MVNREFFEALNMLEKEKRLDKGLLIQSLEAGLASAFKKEFGESRKVVVKLNEEDATINVFAYFEVVEDEIPEEDYQLTLEEAQDINPNAKIGDLLSEDITYLLWEDKPVKKTGGRGRAKQEVKPELQKTFSRIAAQTAKQVIMQRINDARKEQVLSEMSDKQGELMTAVIRRVEGNNVYVEIVGSQLEGVMSAKDQVFGETYRVNDKIKVYIKRVRTTNRGTQVDVSRSSAGFVRRLFELEVPEIRNNLVEIKGIVREAGYRTKMAVYAPDPNIDAIGACIGNKGVRVNAIVSELNGEKVDVILWCADIKEYVARALSPARVVGFDAEGLPDDSIRVYVNKDKLSLAIGKNGQNARLAARLTNMKIDVKAIEDVMGAGAEIADGE